jgi:uridine kinase
MTTRVVGIDGCGGAGKSTLASELSRLLAAAPIIQTDDFASWEDPLGWAPRFLRQVLQPISRNEPAYYQRYDWVKRALGEWIAVGPASIVLIEGVSATRQAFRPYLALSIWVETDRAERQRRGLARDGNPMADHWAAWMADEDAYVARENPGQRAHVVVRGDGGGRANWRSPTQ